MKKISSLILALFIAVSAYAQLNVQVVSQGILNLTYGGPLNDYTLYEPGFEVPTFYIHVWSNGSDNSTGETYDDAWTNSTVTMNWNTGANAYVGSINLNNKNFTNVNKVFPTGTTINNLGFVFKDLQNGATKQSDDIKASNYGFTTTTTIVSLGVAAAANVKKSSVVNGKLYSSLKGDTTVTIYEMSGKMIHTFQTKNEGNAIDLKLIKSGIYLVKITNGAQTEVVKFAK